jgi:nitrogen fixation-related uncharacterized protein
LIPSIIACIVSAIIQACNNSQSYYNSNRLPSRTSIQQGGWQIVGLLLTVAIAALAGVIIGIFYFVFSWNSKDDQFNDEVTYEELPANAAKVN